MEENQLTCIVIMLVAVNGNMHPRGNYVMYHKIFTEFSISFFTLKKDQCELCEAFKSRNVQIKMN
jgi:hypothetical protein